jgi:hypothetical protein
MDANIFPGTEFLTGAKDFGGAKFLASTKFLPSAKFLACAKLLPARRQCFGRANGFVHIFCSYIFVYFLHSYLVCANILIGVNVLRLLG